MSIMTPTAEHLLNADRELAEQLRHSRDTLLSRQPMLVAAAVRHMSQMNLGDAASNHFKPKNFMPTAEQAPIIVTEQTKMQADSVMQVGDFEPLRSEPVKQDPYTKAITDLDPRAHPENVTPDTDEVMARMLVEASFSSYDDYVVEGTESVEDFVNGRILEDA